MPVRSSAASIIAFAVVMAICYFAAAVVEAVLVSIILAIFLDPIVGVLKRIHIPRAMGAGVAVFLLIAVVGLASFFLYNRVQDFAEDVPRYSRMIRRTVIDVRRRIERLEKQTEQVIPPSPRERRRTVNVAEPSLVSRYLFPGFHTAANFLLITGFIPFMVFFMLSWKERLRRSFVDAFSEADRPGASNGIKSIASTMRSYLAGNILVGIILSGASTLLFFLLNLKYGIILGLLSGFLTLIPYLGVVLAVIGPVLVAMPQYHGIGPYLILIGALVGLHIIGLNALLPKIVGRRVNLNPVAVTLALFIWGWMWGAMGLLLAIPITAGAKAVCDNTRSLKRFGSMLGE